MPDEFNQKKTIAFTAAIITALLLGYWVHYLMTIKSSSKQMRTQRYQDNPFWMRWLIWLHWIPYAYLRGIYWYISQLWSDRFTDDGEWYYLEGLHDCIDYSIGDIQAVKMHWVYSGKECMGWLIGDKRHK